MHSLHPVNSIILIYRGADNIRLLHFNNDLILALIFD